MTFPVQNLSIIDPGIAVVAPAATTPVITGVAIGGSGANNVVLSINRMSDVRTILGYGPLAEDVALALQRRGGPVYCVKHTPAAAALTNQAMTQVGTGVPQPTVSGTPTDRFALQVTIVTGGALGTGTFKFSLDAHDVNAAPFTQSQVRTLAASFVIPNTGLTVTFPAGTYVAGDTYSLACIPPEPSTADLATVATLLQNTPSLDFHLWLVSGAQPTAITGAAFAGALSGDATSLATSYRYVRAFCDVGSSDTADNVHTQAQLWTSTRVSPAYGFELIPSALPYEGFGNRKTSCVSTEAIRAMTVAISNDLARFADGPDGSVLKIWFDSFYDQRLDTDGISTMRTWPGIAGFYIAGGKLKAPFGSNFTDVQFGRIMDVACKTAYAAQLVYAADFFRVNTDGSGTIDPRDAATIEAQVGNALADNLTRPTNAKGAAGHVSAFKFTVDRTVNLVTSGQLATKLGIVPFGYAKDIETTLYFTLTP